MTRKQFIKELGKYIAPLQLNNTRIRFYARSPYQAKRYKDEFVGWEAWLYNGKSIVGYLITGEDWSTHEAGRRLIIDTFLN